MCYYIIAIDPGINHFGVTVCQIKDEKIEECVTNTIHVKEKYLSKEAIKKIGLRQCKIDYLNEIFKNYIEYYKPLVVCIESPFYNMKRPAAFLPLVELLYQLRLTLRLESPDTNYQTFEPSTIKKAVGASAICKKEEVKVHVLEKKEIFSLKNANIEDLDEHSIDSLAILYTYVKTILQLDY